MPESDDSKILVQFKHGDRQAIGKLLDRLRPYMRVIVRIALDEQSLAAADESDLIQDVMLQAVRSAKTFQGTSFGELVRWLRMMAIRTSRRALVKNGLRGADVCEACLDQEIVEDESQGPEELMLRQENSAQMAAALNRLPDEMRDVLMFRLVDGLSHGEIADRLNRSPGAVRMLFLRAVERLRDVCRMDETLSWK